MNKRDFGTVAAFITLIVACLCIYLFDPSSSSYIFFAVALILFFIAIKYCLDDLNERVVLFCFLCCLFTFLLSGQIASKLYGKYAQFSAEIENNTDICLFLSVVGLMIGYMVAKRWKWRFTLRRNRTGSLYSYDGPYAKLIRRISLYLFYATFALWFFLLVRRVLFVISNSYSAYYLGYSSGMPVIFVDVANMAPSSLFIFLATMPSRKEVKLPVFIYLVYSLGSILTGRRISFVIGLMLIFCYFMIRNRIRKEGEPLWITKKTMVMICLALPVLLMGLYLYEYVRSSMHSGSYDDYTPIVGFFVRQGVSINVIKYAQRFQSSLLDGAYYSLYNTVKLISKSFLGRLLGMETGYSYGGQTVDTALHSNYLADFVSYLSIPTLYLQGGGLGSCYIAELYVDFGFVGVLLGNVLYGWLLYRFYQGALTRKSIWALGLGFVILTSLMKAPRATFDSFLGDLLSFSTIGTVLFIWLAAYVVRRIQKTVEIV